MSCSQPASAAPARIIEACYRYAYLEQRGQSRPLSAEETGEQLRMRTLLIGDTGPGASPRRRRHRRYRVHMPATVKGPAGYASGFVLDVSGSGLFVTIPGGQDPVELGATLQVRVATPNNVEYLFTGKVVRREEAAQLVGLGLELCCVPLEMRRRRAA